MQYKTTSIVKNFSTASIYDKCMMLEAQVLQDANTFLYFINKAAIADQKKGDGIGN